MDDDAFPREDALEKLVACLNNALDGYKTMFSGCPIFLLNYVRIEWSKWYKAIMAILLFRVGLVTILLKGKNERKLITY